MKLGQEACWLASTAMNREGWNCVDLSGYDSIATELGRRAAEGAAGTLRTTGLRSPHLGQDFGPDAPGRGWDEPNPRPGDVLQQLRPTRRAHPVPSLLHT